MTAFDVDLIASIQTTGVRTMPVPADTKAPHSQLGLACRTVRSDDDHGVRRGSRSKLGVRLSDRPLLMICLMLLASMTSFSNADEVNMRIYIGTYTRGASEGIYVADYDAQTGTIDDVKLAAKTEHPSFVAIHPNGRYLYAVGEVTQYEGEATGFVRAFKIDATTGKLETLNTLKSDGGAPCHLVVDRLGTTLLVANYMGGNVAAFSLSADGSLNEMTASYEHEGSSINARRQEAPHAHSINLDASNRFAVAADLGTDQVIVYEFDPQSDRRLLQSQTPPASLEPGSGPRHFAFHPSGKFAYVINELSSTVTMFGYDASTGSLNSRQTLSTLPADFDGTSHTAEVVVHPSGKFVYGSNRGHDSIAVFSVNPETGTLTQTQVESTGGKTPRNFVVDPAGKFLLAENQGTNTVKVFRIDPTNGKLTATDHAAEVPSPVCIRFWNAPK